MNTRNSKQAIALHNIPILAALLDAKHEIMLLMLADVDIPTAFCSLEAKDNSHDTINTLVLFLIFLNKE